MARIGTGSVLTRVFGGLVLAGTIFGATPAFGQLRATFRDYRTFPGNPVLSTNPNYTYTTDFGTGSRVTMTFTGPQTYTTQAIDGFKLAMDSPQTYGLTGGFTYTAPQEMPTKTHTIGIRVYIKDDSGAGPELCSKTGDPASVSSGQTGTVSAAVSCTLTQIGYYNNSEQDNIQRNLSSLQYWADVTIDGVTNSIRLFGFWQNVSIRNSITLFNPSPSPQVRLAPGTSQAFSASANVTLLGRDNGEIDFRIVDQAGTLQTSPVTQSVSYTGFQRFELSIPAFTIGPGVTRLDLKGSLRNGDQILAESPLISYTVGDDCGLTGRLYREGRLGIYPLPDAAVELWDVTASERLVDKVKAQLKGTFEAPDASYCFKLPASFDYTKRYQIRVKLRDSLEETGAKILIAPSQASILPTEIRWQPFTMTAGTTTRKDLKVDESEIVIPAGTKDTLYAAAEIYWHMWRQVYLMMPLNTTVALSRDLPVEVHLNGTPTSFYCPTNEPAGCLVPSSIVLDRTDSVPGANPSVIWHEFGHHLIRELYAGEIPRPAMSTDRLLDLNHNGFANDYTSASMDEGFATFWAVATSQVFEVPQGRNPRFRWNTPTLANAATLNLDLNFRAVTQASGPGVTNDEEIAFAGLLWDLIDSRVDPQEAAGSGVASDSAAVSLPDVLSVFAQARPGSVARLRTALAAKFPALAAAPAPPATGLSPLDQLFVLHGFFADTNPADLRYSDGEAVGPAANGAAWNGYALGSSTTGTTGTPKVVPARLNRENLRQVPGALLDVRFRDEQGNEVPAAGLDVKVVFPPGLEGWNETEPLVASQGNVYLQMPPAHYGARLEINVPNSPGAPVVISSDTYWRNATPSGSLGTPTFVVPSTPAIEALDVSSGPIGANVVLSGRSFGETAADNVVRFGDVVASVTSATSTRIATIVPSGLAPGAVDITVTARGTTSAARVFTVTAPSAEASPASVDFGSVARGSISEKPVTIRNAGNALLTVRAAASTNSRYRVVSTLPISLTPGAQQTVTLRFSPAAAGAQTGAVHLLTDDPSRRTLAVSVSGTGGPSSGPEIGATPNAYDFGPVAAGSAQTTTFTLRNTGGGPLTVSSASPNGPFTLASPAAPFTVAAGAEQALSVRFAPTAIARVSGSLALASNDAARPTFLFELRGEGVAGGGGGGAPETYATDDGTVESGAIADGLAVVNRFTPSRYPMRLTTIRIFHALFQGLPSPALAPIRLIAYVDPTGAAAASQRPTLLLNQLVTLPSVPVGGGFVDFAITGGPVVTSGDIYVGYIAPSPAGGVVFAADTSGTQRQRGFFSVDGGASFVGPLVLQGSGGTQTPANIMIRAVLTPEGGSNPSGCSFALAHGYPVLASTGGTTSVSVTAPAGCAWSASSDAPWLTVSPSSGSGNGTVVATATANGATTASERSATITIAGLSAPVRQSGPEVEGSTLVPILLSSAGAADAFFTSELTLTNRGTTSALAELTYTAALGGGSGTGTDVIPAGGQITIADAIGYLRSAGVPIPATGNRGGTLRLRLLGVSSPSAVSATARTTSVVTGGRAGLAYADVPAGAAFHEPVTLCGLRQNANDRSNVAVIHAGTAGQGDVGLRLTVVSGDPAAPVRVTLPDVYLAPGGFSQISSILASNGLALTNGYVQVERIAGTAPFYAYAVINDQANSDGSFVPPFPASRLAGRTGMTVPVIVETSTFQSELIATNFGTSTKTLRLTFVADAVQAAGNAATFTLTLRPSEQLILPNLVQYLRDHRVAGVATGSFAGALFATVDGGDVGGIFLGARTSSPGGGGRYGLFYAGVPNGLAATRSAWVFGLQQNADSRSNLALVNTGEAGTATDFFRIEIFDGATGQLVKTLDGEALDARRFKQLTTLLATYAPGTTGGYVKVTRTAGDNPFIVYGVVNDGAQPGQRTGDGAFVPMSAVDE